MADGAGGGPGGGCQSDEQGPDAGGPTAARTQSDDAGQDVYHDGDELDRKPGMVGGVDLLAEGQGQSAGEQRGIDEMRNDAHPTPFQQGGSQEHPDAAQHESADGHNHDADMQEF